MFFARMIICLGCRLPPPRGRSFSICPLISCRREIPISRRILSKKGISMYPTIPASSDARWWLKAGRSKCSATMSNLCLCSSGSRFCARIRLSMYVGSNSSPALRHPARMNPMSNSALWAASGRPSTNFKNAASASSGGGASASMASVMPVRPMISGVSRRPGFTKV